MTLLLQYDSFFLAWIFGAHIPSRERRKEKRKAKKALGLCFGSSAKDHPHPRAWFCVLSLGSKGQTFDLVAQ